MKNRYLIIAFIILVIFFSLYISCDLFDNSDDNFTLADISLIKDLVLGNSGNNDDEKAGAMVIDSANNIYTSMNIVDMNSKSSIIVAKIGSNYTLSWVKLLSLNSMNILQPDITENDLTGGASLSMNIDEDGNLYIVTKGDGGSGQFYSLVLIKLNSVDGSLMASKKWRKYSNEIASAETMGYTINYQDNKIYVSGSTGENKIPILCFDKNLNLISQNELEITSGTSKRAYAIKADSNGDIFLGGVEGSNPFIAKIKNFNSSPEVVFIKYLNSFYGSRISSIDIDDSGVYFSLYVTGVQTGLFVFKTSKEGNLLWCKLFNYIYNDRNNTHIVKVIGNYIYIGGRIGIEPFDKDSGDAILLKLNKTNGECVQSILYYTGKDSNNICEHRIKGIGITSDNKMVIFGQVYGGNYNYNNFYGKWYKISDVKSSDPNLSFTNKNGSITTINGYLNDLSINCADYSINFSEAKNKTTQEPPDCDIFISIFNGNN